MKITTVMLLGAVLATPIAYSSDEISREQVTALMSDCQQQREQRIDPLKTQAIDDCINVKRKDKNYCERFYQHYGQSKTVINASGAAGMFWDLPVCQRAIAAGRFFKANPGKRVYNPAL